MLVCVDTIYADSLLALNLTADYLLLLAAGRVSGAVLRRGRILLAALLGALYALAAVLPQCGFLTRPAAKIALGVGMALIASGAERRFWRCCAAFFALSALFGGAGWAAALLAGSGAPAGLYVPVSWRALILSFGLCYTAVTLFLRRAAPKSRRRELRLTVTLCGRSAALRALVDTGNSLADPVSGRAAAVCDVSALAPLLGGYIDARDGPAAAEALSRRPGLAGRVTLLPYSAVGSHGLLAAVRPEEALADGEPRELLLALSPERLAGGYDAIVPEEI